MTHPFLAEVAPLTHRARIARAVELGRAARRGDEAALATVASLCASASAFERLLGLHTAFGSRDGSVILAGLIDPSRAVRRRAQAMLVLASDAEIARGLSTIVGTRPLHRSVAHLARKGRAGPVDAFVAEATRTGTEPAFVDLVPFASATIVARNLALLDQRGGDVAWTRLAARHPALVAGWFEDALRGATTIDPRLRYRLASRLIRLAERAPDAAIPLVARLFDLGEEPGPLTATLRELVRRRPREAFDLLRARHESARPTHPPGAFGVVEFGNVAQRLGGERLAYLVRHAPSTLPDLKHGPRWFLRLTGDDRHAVIRAFLESGRGAWGAFLFRFAPSNSPEDHAAREGAFERFRVAARAPDGTIALAILAALPRDLREREARRHLEEIPVLASDPQRRLPYAGLLPFAEASTVLSPFLGHPEGEERARALGILVGAVERDRAAMPAALAFLRARKFEQDPVRAAGFEALGRLSFGRFSREHLDDLKVIVGDALDAADLSWQTAAAVEHLVVKLFRLDGDFGAQSLARLFTVRGTVSTLGLGATLTEPEATALSPALATLVEAWSTRERALALVNLAVSLDGRIAVVPPLLDALERLARDLPFVGVAASALALLRRRARARFRALASELVLRDRSFLLLPAIATHVATKQQDLLDLALADVPTEGRFATGRTHLVVDLDRGAATWTEAQNERYAAQLARLLDDPQRDVPTLRFALDRLVRLPFASAAITVRFASDPRPPVREMAVRGLPWLDGREAIATLIVALGDDRARWAIYALRKAFSEMKRAEVLATLRAAPMTKVTVAKEVVRLLGDLGGPDSLAALLALDRPGTHRDVRIALLRALWDHLEEDAVWAIFERAAADPDWVVAGKLADIPLGRLSDTAEARVTRLLTSVLARPEPEARLELLRRSAGLPLRDTTRALFARLLAQLGTSDEVEATFALYAVLTRMNETEVDAVVAALAAQLPSRRRLRTFADALAPRLGPYTRTPLLSVALGFLRHLRADPHVVPLYVALGARLWDGEELARVIADLSQRGLLYFEVLDALHAAVRTSVHAPLLDLRLGQHADPRVRRLGLTALVAASAPKDGWTTERRARLDVYRADRSPEVAGPASFVWPP
jgi:cellulose synthase operon protein C